MRLPQMWRERNLPTRGSRDDFFDRLFGDAFPSWALGVPLARQQGGAGSFGFVPDVDVVERDDGYLIKAELPGVNPEDVKIDVVGNNLEIRGEKRCESEEKEESYYSCERSYGSFTRMIPLPSAVSSEQIQ